MRKCGRKLVAGFLLFVTVATVPTASEETVDDEPLFKSQWLLPASYLEKRGYFNEHSEQLPTFVGENYAQKIKDKWKQWFSSSNSTTTTPPPSLSPPPLTNKPSVTSPSSSSSSSSVTTIKPSTPLPTLHAASGNNSAVVVNHTVGVLHRRSNPPAAPFKLCEEDLRLLKSMSATILSNRKQLIDDVEKNRNQLLDNVEKNEKQLYSNDYQQAPDEEKPFDNKTILASKYNL